MHFYSNYEKSPFFKIIISLRRGTFSQGRFGETENAKRKTQKRKNFKTQKRKNANAPKVPEKKILLRPKNAATES
jgi:hypothetical protein